MTLPFSDKPEKSSIYQDVKTETLQELTPDQFDAFKARMFSEGVNGLEDEYRRLLLLGLASDKISVAGPLPGTSINVQNTFTASGSGSQVTFLEPAAGEVWALQSIGTTNNVTGNPVVYGILKDAADVEAFFVVGTQSGSPFTPDSEFGAPIYIDENMKCNAYVFVTGGIGAGEQVVVTMNFIRIR